MTGEGEIRILIIDGGRNIVGRLYRHPDLAFHWRVESSRIIRQWGTTEGLEQIANDGPTPNTKLDRACNVTVPFRAVVEILDTTEELWESHLPSDHSSERPKKTKDMP